MGRKLTYIDLFCGAGGLALGFDANGFKNIFSLDNDPTFCATYKRNFPEHTLLQADIADLSGAQIAEIVGEREVDVIVGGPPCQGFSMAGNIGRKFIDDPRNHLFKEFARVVSIIRPKFFVMENVARLYTHNKGETRKEIINTFEKMGYEVKSEVVNAADFGVPQVRRRVLFIGSLDGPIKLPEITHIIHRTIKEAIDDLPVPSDGESVIQNHEQMKHSEQMLKKMSYVSDGGDRFQMPKELRPHSGDVRKYIRYNSNKPAVCVTGDMRKIFHYSQNRALTVRELARLQTFPDDFIFEGNKISQQQQVGNAVPPLLAAAIAKSVKEMAHATVFSAS